MTHEGLVRIFDYCEPESLDAAPRPFVVMESVDGQSLARRLHAGPLGTARIVDIVAQVSAALQAMHRAGLAHGDIGPEKILAGRDGAAKLIGFGRTCPAESSAIAADLGALGVLARECLDERAKSGDGGAPSRPPESVTELIADLCARESADQPDATAAIARRAGALSVQVGAPSRSPSGSPTPSSSPTSSAQLATSNTRRPSWR